MSMKKNTKLKGHNQQHVETEAPNTSLHEGLEAPAPVHSPMLAEDRANQGAPLEVPTVY